MALPGEPLDVQQLLQFGVNGVVLGSILALAGIGLTLAYGILSLSNFAHGDFVTLGAFLTLLFAVELLDDLVFLGLAVPALAVALLVADRLWRRRLAAGERFAVGAFAAVLGAFALLLAAFPSADGRSTGLVLLVAALLAVAFSVLGTLGLEAVVWRPLRRKKATILTLVIVSVGIALVVRNSIQLYFGTGLKSFERPSRLSDTVFGLTFSVEQQFTLVAALVLIGAVHALLRYTLIGKAMRALADNRELARVSGIDVDRIIAYVWVLSASLTAIAGVLLTLVANNTMHVNMGWFLLLPLFASVILGGIGSAYGAMIGGFAVGISMKTSAAWLGSEYELASAFLILIGVLLFRPQGILGVKP